MTSIGTQQSIIIQPVPRVASVVVALLHSGTVGFVVGVLSHGGSRVVAVWGVLRSDPVVVVGHRALLSESKCLQRGVRLSR